MTDTSEYKPIKCSCQRCGRGFTQASSLRDHYNKKKTCRNLLNCPKSLEELLKDVAMMDRTSFLFVCVHCQKRFKTKPNLNQHSKRCKASRSDTRPNTHTDSISCELEAHRKEIDDLRKQIELLKSIHASKEGHVTNNVTINSHNNNITVVVNNFGSEDVSHILEDKEFLDKCLLSLQKGIPDVVERIYYDDAKPENKTVVLKSAKHKTASICDNQQWVIRSINYVVPIMVRAGSSILSQHLRNIDTSQLDEEQVENILTKHIRITDVITQKKPEYDMTASAVKAIMHNHR